MPISKSCDESRTHMTEMVLPQHTNAYGTAFGGVIMSWMDICAAISARRHANAAAVTASVDELHFLKPIRLGDTVVLNAHLTSVGYSSMEIFVHVTVEPADFSRSPETTTEAYFTFVALDDEGKPKEVPALGQEENTPEDPSDEILARRNQRLAGKERHRQGIRGDSKD